MRNCTAACLAAATWLLAQQWRRPPRRRLPAPPDRARRAELRAFARAWLARPLRVGAILPTSAAVRISQGVPALRARTSRYRELPSSRRPRAVRGTVVTVNPDAVRSLRAACSGQVR